MKIVNIYIEVNYSILNSCFKVLCVAIFVSLKYFSFAFIWSYKVVIHLYISFTFHLYIYLRSKILLLLLFVITSKWTRWSANVSQSHFYFSIGIICGPKHLWITYGPHWDICGLRYCTEYHQQSLCIPLDFPCQCLVESTLKLLRRRWNAEWNPEPPIFSHAGVLHSFYLNQR